MHPARPRASFAAIRAAAAACAALAAAAGLCGPAAARDADWPAHPIRLIVPFDAGGVADITARVFAQRIGGDLGQQVVVENRPGAGGIVATGQLTRATPDGYTLLLISSGTAVSASLFRSLPYDTLRDLAPISTFGFFDIALLAGPDSAWKSAAAAVADARARPGRINIGTINVGSTQHLSAELFKSMAGLDVQIVPFKSTAAVVSALRGGDVQLAFEVLAPVYAQIRSGALRALAVAGAKRFAGLPAVPTLAESAVPGYRSGSWNGIAAPAGTPAPVIDRLARETRAAALAPEVADRLAGLGVVAHAGTPAETRELLAAEIEKWRAVIQRAGIERQ